MANLTTHDTALAEQTEYIVAPATHDPSRPPRVVVIGAGFGGLSATQALARAGADVLLINRNNYHGFWPLLYQVATAGLEPESIAYPVRAILRQHNNAAFQMAEVTGIDFEARLVLTDGDPIAYDYLVIAAGSTSNFFGNDTLAKQTFGLKDLPEAARLRNHVLRSFEQAAREPDAHRRAALMTFVVVGGGPTGVELAGAFAELIRDVLRKDYPKLDMREARVLLIEAGSSILATFPERLQRAARRKLDRMGVDVQTEVAVASVVGDQVLLKGGSSLAAATVVWAAGVRANELADDLGVEQARGGRVKITPTLNLAERPEVFVIGDMAYLEGYRPGVAYPMVAPVAIQMGTQAAHNILALIRNQPLREFRYFDKGQMATIGRRAAVLDAFGIRLTGFIAWLGWLIVHLLELIGFRNRLVVLMNWAYNYLTYDRGVRLIIDDQPPPPK
ncbi:MAG TPA: NAD(P)/FAD-dependent oxidoreductase [Roseiflexaceae bacterium]|nr:NAD(P)/FAD-dependent oxidoreductase [Roseiflexaceae bacterium]HMP42026.1 NAD(P)/FAD-dependent oxidoreductase [Roseiflexaceae bacterium]